MNTILSLWEQYLPRHLPSRYGLTEPLRKKFDINDKDNIFENWALSVPGGLFAERNSPYLEAHVFLPGPTGPGNLYSDWMIRIDSADIETSEILELVKAAASALSAEIAFAHRLTHYDISRMKAETGAECPLLMLHTKRLQHCLPDIYWCMVFGPSYLEMFGTKRLLSMPCYSCELLAPDLFFFQLSESHTILEKDPTEFEVARTLARYHLNAISIFEPELGPSYPYTVPKQD